MRVRAAVIAISGLCVAVIAGCPPMLVDVGVAGSKLKHVKLARP